MKTLHIDWDRLPDEDAFYDAILAQMDAPAWHGRNLNALQDSLVVGSISPLGPPFRFEIRGRPFSAEFGAAFLDIARDSIASCGGELAHEESPGG